MSRLCAFRFVFALLILTVVGVGCPRPQVDLVGPTAGFDISSSQGFLPLKVQFTDRSEPGDSNIYAWFWDFGDGRTSTQRNPSHMYYLSGTYTVSLTVTSGVRSHTVTRQSLLLVKEPVAVTGIGPAGGTIEAEGASLEVPAGIFDETVVFTMAVDEDAMRVNATESEVLVSDVYTIGQNYGDVFCDVDLPMTLTIPFSALLLNPEDLNSTKLQILAHLSDGTTIPVPADVEQGALVASIAGLPTQAAYAVVYRPLAESVAVATSKPVWSSGTWRMVYSELALQELTALREGNVDDVDPYDRRDYSDAQCQTTLAQLRSAVSTMHSEAHDAGFYSPALIPNADGEYSLLFYRLAEPPLPNYESVGELTYTTSIFGSIVVDPLQLIEISKRNAQGTPDEAQELGVRNAFAQEFYRSVFRGYEFPPLTEDPDGASALFSQGLEDGLATYLGQVSDGLNYVRSLGPNEYGRLDEPLFAPESANVPMYSYSSQDFLAYVMKYCAPSDPFIFLGDAYQGVLSVLQTNLVDLEADSYDEALEALRLAVDTALDLSYGQSLADVYWQYAKDRAYERAEISKLRTSDKTKQALTVDTDVFKASSIVDADLTVENEPVMIGHSQHAALSGIKPMSTRVVRLNAGNDVEGTLNISSDWNNWVPDALGNSIKMKVYRNGHNGTEMNENSPSMSLANFGVTPDGFDKAVIVISNVSVDTSYSVSLSAEVVNEVLPTKGSLSGHITIANTSTPISGVTVQVRPEGSVSILGTATTNAAGEFLIENLQAGPITISLSKTGYTTPPTLNRTIVAGQNTFVAAQMEPAP